MRSAEQQSQYLQQLSVFVENTCVLDNNLYYIGSRSTSKEVTKSWLLVQRNSRTIRALLSSMLLNEDAMASFLLSAYVYCFILSKYLEHSCMIPQLKVLLEDRGLEAQKYVRFKRGVSLKLPSNSFSYQCRVEQ